jgi:hypothetical protein
MDPQALLQQALGGKAGKVEPTAALRASATTLYAMFQAYVDAGFRRGEALELVKTAVASIVTQAVVPEARQKE